MKGFTLIEMVITLALITIVAAFSVALIGAPPVTLDTANRRASVTDSARLAMRQVGTELRDALPNSLRARANGSVLALEYLQVLDSAMLFEDSNGIPGDKRLRIGNPDPQFATIGEFRRLAKPVDSTTLRVALHHTGLPGANAWAQTNVISPAETQVRIDASGDPDEDRVRLNPAVTFTSVGESRRVYVLSGPVTYLCDSASGTLRRYAGYTMAASQDARDSDAELMAAGATRALLADRVRSCRLATTVSATSTLTVYDLAVQFGDGTEVLLLTANHVNDSES